MLSRALDTWSGLPHRLEYVGYYKDIHWYNDSLSTVPEACIFALETLGNRVETLIVGGYDRGVIYDELGQLITQKSSTLRNLILFPTTGEKIWEAVKRQKQESRLPKKVEVQSMQEAVLKAQLMTSKK